MSGGEREGVVEVLEWRGERICVGGGGGCQRVREH